MDEQLTREIVLEILADILDDETTLTLAAATYQALLDSPQLPLVLLEYPELARDIKHCEIMLG